MLVRKMKSSGEVSGEITWFSHFSTRSAGVAILKGNFKGQIFNHEMDSLGRMLLHIDIDHTPIIVCQ